MAESWKALSEEEKQPYEAKAAEDKERYVKECEAAGIEVKQPKEKAEKTEKVRAAPSPSPSPNPSPSPSPAPSPSPSPLPLLFSLVVLPDRPGCSLLDLAGAHARGAGEARREGRQEGRARAQEG